MNIHTRRLGRCLLAAFLALPLLAFGQTLNIHNDVQTRATLASTVATLTGKAELHVTGTGDPIAGSVIHLDSPDAWFFMTNIAPSTVASTFLSRVRVNGAVAVADLNVRVTQFARWLLVGTTWTPVNGTVVIPHAPTFAPLEVFDGASFTGASKLLTPYTAYGWMELGGLNDKISSLKLKRGYMATIAQNPTGDGPSRNYVAADGDLEIGALPTSLNNAVSFVRVFPWRWVSKKGSCDVSPTALNAQWHYNWSNSMNSTRDWEYVLIKQQPYWPGLGDVNGWRTQQADHVLGFNEPNNPVEDAYKNLTPVGSAPNAAARWPELLGTGMRVGAPAVTDGGYSWIVDFMNQANTLGHRVDYVPVHFYRSYANNDNPAGAAGSLYAFLKSIYDNTGKRPIWVTEFNNGANWTDNAHDPSTAQNRNVIEAMIEMMDATPWIERYAIYSNVEWFRDTHYDDGSYTPMGAMYRDHVAPPAYLQDIPAPGISAAAQFTFDGQLRDGRGNGNDAMAVGAPVFAAGKYGQAISLDGATDYLQLPAQLGDSGDFTFAAWIYWAGGANWQRVFDFGSGTLQYLFLSPKAGGNTLRFAIKNGGAEQQLNWTAALPVNTWTHVAVTIAGDTGKLFVNGSLVNTNAALTINPDNTESKFNYIGKSQFQADPLFSGRLDDVRFLTTALTDAEIATLSTATPPAFTANPLVLPAAIKLQPYTGSIAGTATGGTGAITYSKAGGPAWLAVAANGALTGVPGAADGGLNNFLVRASNPSGAMHLASLQITVGEAAGMTARYAFNNTVNAAVGTANGTASGSPAYVAGRFGEASGALLFDGTDDAVTLPHGVASHAEITVATWVYWNGGNQWQRIFDFGNGTTEHLFVTPRSGTNTLRFTIVSGGVSNVVETAQLAASQWIHVAVTLGGGAAKLYVNGVQAATAAATLKPTDMDPAVNYLGDSQFAADPLFAGRLDEFQIFGRVLSSAEISAIHTGRAPAFAIDPITKPAGAIGQTYEQTLASSATDPNAGSTLTYSKVSGPRWLTVAPNGRISGVPSATDAGINRFLVRVTDGTLLADDATLNIDIPEPSDLLAHYEFDGSLANSSGGTPGTATGAPAYAAGLFDRALNFDGTDDLVQLSAGAVNGLSDLTIAVRVRWGGGNDWQRIFDFGSNTNQYLFLSPKGGGNLVFSIKNGAGTDQTLTGPVLPIGEWTHVAVTLVGNTGTLYVNGAAVTNGSITIDPATFAPTLNYLGDSQYTADPLFNGSIDDFRIYNRGLAGTEIASLAVPPATVIVPDPSFAGWAAAISFPPGTSGPGADAESDGLPNFFEWLFGTDPLAAGPGGFSQGEIRSGAVLGGAADPAKNYLSFQVRVRKNRPATSFVAEAGATVDALALPGASAHAIQAGAPVSEGSFEIFTYYYDVAIEDSPAGAGFLRLRGILN